MAVVVTMVPDEGYCLLLLFEEFVNEVFNASSAFPVVDCACGGGLKFRICQL